MVREPRPATARDRLIVALDVGERDAALRLVEGLRGHVGAFKVGLELVNAVGAGIWDDLRATGADRIFYDCKLHDIPNTVEAASRAIRRRGLWMMNVHAAGGIRMVGAARHGLEAGGREALDDRAILLGVTLLTSLASEELASELAAALPRADYVRAMARLTQRAGGDGVVASALEAAAVREACGDGFLIVTPGIRPAGSDAVDQRRVVTPAEAVARGADYLVVGRPITRAPSPRDAADRVVEAIASAL
ncbi:MAG: orotidine-5'-phosphate decarboxylase [Chthonomonadales bacterium]|nr:orotidine-5'-phosphate decarboxylase [Chthonomonadales bacterium]